MKYRVLTVDDNPEILEAVGEVLCSLGHDYDTAMCQEEARQLLAENNYSYYLLDLEIPVQTGRGFARIQNGENLLREILSRRNGRSAPVIIMTGHGTDSPHLAVEMMKLGASDYITKPFASVGKTLDRAILEALRKSERPSSTGDVEPFSGGELVLTLYRAELLGVTVWHGRPEMLTRLVLGVLAERRSSGKYVAYSGHELATKVGCPGEVNNVAGVIRDFRQEVIRVLRDELGLECGTQDVIQSGGPGYRFNPWIDVRMGDGDVERASDDLADPEDDDAKQRREWILAELAKGRRSRIPDIAAELGCSARTVRRELAMLRAAGRVEFVGAARSGWWGLVGR